MYSKYKDSLPFHTFQKADKVLTDLDIPYTISCLKVNSKSSFSLRVQYSDEERVGTNGKGTSYEYALASGMAEFIERLQAGCLSKLEYIEQENLNRYNFISFPDEKKFLPFIINQFLIPKLGNFTKQEKDFLSSLLADKESLVCNSYYSVKRDKIIYLPDKVIKYLTGTNGLAAGNTPEEALTQGFSEIAERYCLFKVMKEQLTPPEIPIDYLQEQYSGSYFLYANLMNSTRYRYTFRFYDLSLGKGFPVVGMIIIDNNTRKYRFIAGSHPSFSVAIERCLTEIGQGLDLVTGTPESNYFNLEFTYDNEEENLYQRYRQFTTGSGKMPRKCFDKEKSWKFKPWDYDSKDKTNKDNVKLFLDLFSFASDIYIKDLSFTGFNTYRIFIPDVNAKYFDWIKWKEYKDSSIDDTQRVVYNNIYNKCKEKIKDSCPNSLSLRKIIGVWCNGNILVSGTKNGGSNPSAPENRI